MLRYAIDIMRVRAWFAPSDRRESLEIRIRHDNWKAQVHVQEHSHQSLAVQDVTRQVRLYCKNLVWGSLVKQKFGLENKVVSLFLQT